MLDLQPSSFEAFVREAGQGNVVPVVRSVLGDLHTPVGTFMRIAGNSRYAFLLESVEGGERIAKAHPQRIRALADASAGHFNPPAMQLHQVFDDR